MARRPIHGEPLIPTRPRRVIRPPRPIKLRRDYDIGGLLWCAAVAAFGMATLCAVAIYVRALP